MYDDGLSGGMRIISLIGSLGRLDKKGLEPGLEECVGGLCGLGLIKEADDFSCSTTFLYLTTNGKRIYTKLKDEHDN